MAVIWNPCIRKSIAIHLPQEFNDGSDDEKVLGFGVCPVTLDPKIVLITHLCPLGARRRKSESKKQFGNFWKVNVYKLSSGKFINLSSNLPGVSMRIQRSSTQVVIDRIIYWCAEFDGKDGTTRNMIMSFDITDEKFKALDIPDSLASLNRSYFSVSKLKESLVILERSEKRDSYHVWKMMDHTNLFTIKAPCGSISIRALGFRKTGVPLLEVRGGSSFRYPSQLVAYDEPNSRRCNHLILGFTQSYFVESYMETLLFIGRSDCSSF